MPVADGAPAESFRDDGSGDAEALPPCAPIVASGPVLDRLWRHLADRAGLVPAPTELAPDLRLAANGAGGGRASRSKQAEPILTDGDASLASALLAGPVGTVLLELRVAATAAYPVETARRPERQRPAPCQPGRHPLQWPQMRRSLFSLLPWHRPRVPVVELHGLISSRGALNLRAARPLIEGAFRAVAREGTVMLDIDSPGGSPVQSDLIAALIRRQAEKAGARVVAVVGEVGASGGYWLACAADEIRAHPMSVVGSIGVIGGGFGVPALLARAGVERRLYTAGENKARLDPFSPERPEDVTFVQSLIDDIHTRFKDWVRQRRAGKLKADEAVIFDGSFFLGQRALALGLIDGFGDIDTVVRELAGERARARHFRPKRRLRLLGRLPRMLTREAVPAALDALEEHAAAPRARI